MKGFLGLLVLAVLTACGTTSTPAARPITSSSSSATLSATAPPVTPGPAKKKAAPLGTVPPTWLGTRPLPRTSSGFGLQKPTPRVLRMRRFTLPDSTPMLPGTGFAAKVVDPAPPSVVKRSTWAPGCPVRAHDLAWVRLAFFGFDRHRHSGELLVNGSVANDIVRVFHVLWNEHFPIEQMVITSRADRHARPTGDGNDTASFNCRPVRGARIFSQHAYGLAVDVNPFQNPYLKDALVLPELAGSYRDRTWHRPGMILPGGAVVRAFRSIGWTWGGSWHSLKDLQHFSRNGG